MRFGRELFAGDELAGHCCSGDERDVFPDDDGKEQNNGRKDNGSERSMITILF